MTKTTSKPWISHVAREWRPLVVRHGLWVMLSTAVCLALAVGHILWGSKSYRASQSLAVRDDLLGESFKPGRYTSLETLKNAQEIVSHLARRPAVIRDAWRAAFPNRAQGSAEDWPTEKTIEELQSQITVTGSNGAEFGKTEVVVLALRQPTRLEAQALVEQLTNQVERHLRELRISQLRSMRLEQEQAVETLERGLAEFNCHLQGIENELGADLGSLRALIENSSGQNELLRAIEGIRAERRGAARELEQIEQQLLWLASFERDQDLVAGIPKELLGLHPTLQRLYDGLVDAQLKASTQRGLYTEQHAAVAAAEYTLSEVHQQLMTEVHSIQRHLHQQYLLAEQNASRLARAEAEYESKLAHIGRHRVEYQSLLNELNKRTEALGQARNRLLELQALTGPTADWSLVTPVGAAQVETRPDGPSKSALLLAALLGGLALGTGIVALRLGPDELAALSRRSAPGSVELTPPDTALGAANSVADATRPPSSERSEKAATAPGTAAAVPSTTAARVKPIRMVKSAETIRPATVVKQMESAETASASTGASTPIDDNVSRAPKTSAGAPRDETAGAARLPPTSTTASRQAAGDLSAIRARVQQIISSADPVDLAGLRVEELEDDAPNPVQPRVISSVDAYCQPVKRVPRDANKGKGEASP